MEREFDFYTAVDDLKPEDTAGADMMGTVEFNSACFYRYAVVDWGEARGKTCRATPNWPPGPACLSRRLRGGRTYRQNRTPLPPTTRRNSYWSRCVAIRHRAIWPMRSRQPSAPRDSLTQFRQRALGKARVLQAAYGGESSAFVLDLTGAEIGDAAAPAASLAALIDAVMAEVRRG